jgi:hypothetical protein
MYPEHYFFIYSVVTSYMGMIMTDLLADLHKTMRRLYALPPAVIALWVVDQPAGDAYALKTRLERAIPDIFTGQRTSLLTGGIRFICHSSRTMTAEGREQALAAGRWWVFVPGYWLEWSDRTIGRLQWPEGTQHIPLLFKKEHP